MNALETLSQKRAEVVASIDAIKAKAAADNRVEFTEDEATQLDNLLAAAEHLNVQIDRLKKTEAISATMSVTDARQVQAVATSTTTRAPITGGSAGSANAANHGFSRGFSEFLTAVRNAAYGRTDQRLLNAVTTYGGEAAGPDGGFATPPEWSAQINQVVMGEDSLTAKFNPIMTGSNQVIIPVDETSAYGTTGIYAEWLGEAGAMTDRKPVLQQRTVTLNKVGVMVQLSDELASDAPAIQSFVMRKSAEAITSKVNEALVTGNGVAKPLGLLSAPGLITQAKTASTLAAIDLGNMLSRLLPQAVNDSFWLVHSSVLPKLWTLVLSNMPVYATDFRVSPYGTLLGRPVFTSEFCSDYNTLGDLFLVSPSGYLLAVKAGGVQTAASIHWAFNQDVQSFRATMRVGGTPLASAATARKNGTTTLGHIVAMGVRS